MAASRARPSARVALVSVRPQLAVLLGGGRNTHTMWRIRDDVGRGDVRRSMAMSDERFVFNHLGHCVTDLDRSRRFYEAVLGFEFWREIRPPDASSARLLGLSEPLDMTACYLRRDGLVLELLHFGAVNHRRTPATRALDEPGLTHLSVSCDIDAVRRRAVEYGGEVLDTTDIGVAVFIRDPDGQLIELLPLAYADHLAGADGVEPAP